MAKILVTGSLGVVGSKLTENLSQRGHDVFGIGRSHSHVENYQRCDIGDYRQLKKVFDSKRFDYVYNCAAEFGRWNGEDYYEKVWKSNAIGLKNIIRFQEEIGFKLIHFSSSEIYGDYEDIMHEDVPDNIPIKQMNDYAISKWVNELQIINSAKQFGTNTVRVRLFNSYGPGEKYSPYRSVNCKFCYSAIKGLPITVYKGHWRTSTYLDDMVRTLANIVENFKSGEVYNIGGEEFHTIEKLADIIWDYTKANRKLIVYKESEGMTTKIKKINTDKSIRDLSHKNTVLLEEGIHNTIDWMKMYYA